MPSPAVPVELLERDGHLAQLDAGLAAGEGRLILVAGETGVGKTTLVRTFCARLHSRTRVLSGACDGMRTPRALGPLVDIAAQTGGELADAVAGAQPARCFEALADEVDDSRPTVVVIEDVHWADDATLDVLLLLARRAARVRALVIVTYRDDELQATHPLRRVIGNVPSGAGVGRLTLPCLSAAGVDALAAPLGYDGAALYRRTGGNAFFVTEVLQSGDGLIPETARDAVLARAARASPGARRVLDAIAVVPQPVEVWLLEALLGADLAELDECLDAGMLVGRETTVAFRHELARLAIEDAIAPHRRVALHRAVLRALEDHALDPARLAHHAEAADDGPAVLELATRAGARATTLGAHREAEAHYRRALRHADDTELVDRVALLDRYAHACSLTAAHDEEIAALEALDGHRRLGDRRAQGDTMRRLSGALWCKGGHEERADRLMHESVAVLEPLGDTIELAEAYSYVTATFMDAEDLPRTLEQAERSLALSERLGDESSRVHSLNNLATIQAPHGTSGGRDRLRSALALAQQANHESEAGRAFLHLGWSQTRRRHYDLAAGDIAEGLGYCRDHDLELYALYLYAYRSRIELDRGDLDAAASSAAVVIDDSRASRDALVPALAVLGLVRARRGDPDQDGPINRALALTRTASTLQSLGPVATARAELLWLAGRHDEVAGATQAAFDLARARGADWFVGELALWRRRAGITDDVAADEVTGPYALSLSGDAEAAAGAWRDLGCPYEAALALADADRVEARRRALDELQALSARPAAGMVAGALRASGVRGLPRGPRTETRRNPAGLTTREVEVVQLLAEGLRNAQIAARLVVSEKTVGNHVSAIMRKLDAGSRGAAVAAAARLGLLR